MEDTRKITISIQEDPQMLARIDQMAEEEGTSRSAIIRRAIRRLVFSTSAVPTFGNSPESAETINA